MTSGKLATTMHECFWPECHRRLKYAAWCESHWYRLPDEYKRGARTQAQPTELVRAAHDWIARLQPRQCARCQQIVGAGSCKIRLHWPDSEANDLVIDLCEACTVALEAGLGMRWCDECALWTRASHPIHGPNTGRPE